MIKSRKLYQVRHCPAGLSMGRTVGHKCRLMPRDAALRVARRLRAAGVDAHVAPLIVNVTPEQAAYLAARYGV